MKQSPVSSSFLKQRARQIKKEKSLSQHQALDEAAKEFGFSNYRHYLNQSEASSKDAVFQAVFAEQDTAKRLGLAISYLQKYEIPFHDLFDVLKLFRQSEEALNSICEKTSLKDDVQKFLLKFFQDFKRDLQVLPMREHFVAKDISVRDFFYEMRENALFVGCNYDLEFKFEFEVPEEMKNEPHFHREPMVGDVAITIDRSKIMTIGNPSIGEDADGEMWETSFLVTGLSPSLREANAIESKWKVNL